MNTIRIASIAAAIASITAAAPAAAQYQCYDFSGLAVGAEYNIGQTVNANHATITFRPYKMSGNPVGEKVNSAEVQQAKIAGGAPPEMGMKTLTVQIEPNQPITRMRVRLAQNMTPTGGFGVSNFEVNGEQHEGPSFASVNGKRLGGAEFSATFANNAGNWHVGTVELRAKPGGAIKSFSIGGHTWRLDDMCIAK
jgi:hypothetical protein